MMPDGAAARAGLLRGRKARVMNSEENNEKQIAKLARMERIYADEKKHESVIDKIEDDDEDVCAVARKFFRWALLVVWAACLFTLVSGGDFTLPAAAILVTGGIYAALCITKFLHAEKLGDAIVSAVIAVALIGLGIILLVSSPSPGGDTGNAAAMTEIRLLNF